MRNLIPGGKVDDSRLGQAENGLEGGNCRLCPRAVDSVLIDSWNGGVYSGDGIQLFLDVADFIAGGTQRQLISRPGNGNAGNLVCRVDVNAFPVEVAEDLNGAVALLAQGTGSPLGQPDRKCV